MTVQKNILITCLVLLTLVAAAEIGARLYGIKPGVYVRNRYNIYQFDETIGWQPKPNTSFVRVSAEYFHTNYYNPQGLPTDKAHVTEELKKDPPKVALIGNSLVESYYVPYEISFPYLFNEYLKDKNMEVLNLGVSGYTPGQYMIRARRLLPQFNVKKIFIIFTPLQDIINVDAPSFGKRWAKPVFGQDLTKPTNTPLTQIKLDKDVEIETYSALATALQPLRHKWFGYVSKHFNFNIKPEDNRFTLEGFKNALRYFKQIQTEFPAEVVVLYSPAETEYDNDQVLDNNFKLYYQACNEMKLTCKIPDFYIQDKKNYHKYFYSSDHHPSPYGAVKMADYLKTQI